MELPSRSAALVVIESVLSGAFLFSSFVGNFLVIVIVFKKPRLCTTTSIYIAALATTDLLNACLPGPLFLASLITGEMPYNSAACNLGGFFMHFLMLVSVTTMGLIAINRYYCVLKPNRYKRVFSTHRSVSYLVCLWTFVAIFTWIPVIGGWAEMAFNPLMACCNCYSVYGKQFFDHRLQLLSRLKVHSAAQQSSCNTPRPWRAGNQADKYILCSGIVICGAMDAHIYRHLSVPGCHKSYPRLVGLAVPFLLQVNSAINPWIYGAMNPAFRKKFKQLLRLSSENQLENIHEEHSNEQQL